MIRLRTDFFAESLGMGTSMVVLMPQAASGIGMEEADATRGSAADESGVPVLYLLHGLSDDCTIWERRTSIERYATEKGIAVVMPEVRRSFYTDEAVGEAYWTFVAEEPPRIVARTFRVSTAREDTFVAGLSMGGFGAFKLALNHPERFAAAASLSGALDPASLSLGLNTGHLAERVWSGRGIAGTADDLLGLVGRRDPAERARPVPRLRHRGPAYRPEPALPRRGGGRRGRGRLAPASRRPHLGVLGRGHPGRAGLVADPGLRRGAGRSGDRCLARPGSRSGREVVSRRSVPRSPAPARTAPR
ncbi:alpha/beta hydrolase-fold protein [Brachybacterium sp. GPGPB12]|uniref:alpha/beta hydrolase n=1 Tax=Brachybacterium sp. GPGPB12 TaxID=3023517 RepID=UPI0031345489